MSIHSRLSEALRREVAKWNRWDWAMAVAATALFSFVMATVLSPALYAQTWGILYGREVQVIGSTATVKLHGSEDASGSSAGVELRYTGGNNFDFYVGPSVTNTIEFQTGSVSDGALTWLEIRSPAIAPPSPVFLVPVEFIGAFISDGGVQDGQLIINQTDALLALDVASSDSNQGWRIYGSGKQEFQDAAGAYSVNLYVCGPNILCTDDAFHVGGLLVPLIGGGTDPAATCTPFQLYLDTDGSTTNTNCTGGAGGVARVCGCVSTDTWVGL